MSVRPLEGFLAVRSEGGLLPADLLQRIVGGDREIEGLDPQGDYHLAGGERLNEAVGRSWQRLLGAWRTFRAAAAFLEQGDAATTLTRERWLLVLFQELGYGRLSTSKAISVEGREYPVSHIWQRIPIHLVGCKVEIDKRTPGVAGAARTTPHGLVQDFLNRSSDHMWGFVSNGLRLRLLRDNARLARQAYVEFDLETIFENELYADFGLLWLLCHQSRVDQDRPEGYWLEQWRQSAAKQGARALDTLRDGVEAALLALGCGFLAHPANAPLKAALQGGSLSTQDYYRELLRLVYRLLFLFVAEDRDVLHARDVAVAARQRYVSHYSSRRLRELARRMRGSGHADLFRMFQVVVSGLSGDEGCSTLGLPALGGLLWSDKGAPHLDAAELANKDWLKAVRALAYTKQDGVLRPVDWRNLGSTEFGSVYESLLELHPDVNADAAAFSLSSGAGNERKTSGSYYTPDSLVQCLLDTALDPVLAEGAANPDPEHAILALKVCDPACGSGHFLIAAAHRIARRLAKVRTGDDEPAPEATRTALRDIVGRCLYGVDLNPMAAELCKVNLWLEGMEPGKPLSFLDHHIRVGNSLLGAASELIAAGLPDGAFTAIEGDNKKACAVLKKRNKAERKALGPLFAQQDAETQVRLQQAAAVLEELPDDRPEDIRAKELTLRRCEATDEYRAKKQLADAWCAAFVIKKHLREPGRDVSASGITQGHLNDLAAGRPLPADRSVEIERLLGQYRFFHWHLAFPEVFAKGGFDCVLGNPPWERVKLQEKEWFAERSPEIANAPNAAARKRMIDALKAGDPVLHQQFLDDSRKSEGESHVMRNSGRYPLCGRGDINVYSVFAEAMRTLLNERGRVGCVLPSGIATDDTTKFFFQEVVETKSLASLFDFENKGIFFPGVHSSYKFCLFTAGRGLHPTAESAEFVFFAHAVEELRDRDRRFTLSAEDIALLNPNTRTCPIFRSRKDAELTKAIYRRVPVLIREAQEGRPEENPWGVTLATMFHMTNDSHLFRTQEQLQAEGWRLEGNVFARNGDRWMPIYEGKMVSMYDHRSSSITINPDNAIRPQQKEQLSHADHVDPEVLPLPYLWGARDDAAARTPAGWGHQWFPTIKRVTASTNERMLVGCVIPWSAVSYTLYIVTSSKGTQLCVALLTTLCTFAADYLARQKTSQPSLPIGPILETAIVAPGVLEATPRWNRAPAIHWLIPRAVELTYTAWDLEPFAQDCGWSGPPFRWDEERRFLLRCELDAAFFHLYLGPKEEWHRQPEALTKDFPAPRHAADYIMETFPIVKRKDEATHGEYRTKRVVLEIYDEMQHAMDTGRPYETRLDPSPADPRVAHSARAVVARAGPAKVLPFRRLGRAPNREERYTTAVPLLTLKAAAGTFGETQDVEFDEWVEPANPPKLQKGMFLAQVTGRSMEPEIPEGSYCLFRYVRPGSREGNVVLVQLHGHSDPEGGGSYTVKRYHSEKERGEDGEWRHARITLKPANPEYEPIVLGAEDEGEVRVVAELVSVL